MCSNSYLNHYIKVGQLPKCMVSCVESTGQLLMKRVVSSSEICTHAMHMTKEISNSDVRDQLLVKLSLHLAGINEDKICKQTIEICTNSQNESSNQAD